MNTIHVSDTGSTLGTHNTLRGINASFPRTATVAVSAWASSSSLPPPPSRRRPHLAWEGAAAPSSAG